MLLARKCYAQYEQYNKTICEIFLEEITLLLSRFGETEGNKRGIIGILFKATVGIASEAASVFIRQRKVKPCIKLYML